MRTFFKRFFALLKLMSILVNALQHLPKGVTARQMPETNDTREWPADGAALCTDHDAAAAAYRNVTRPERISRLPARLFSFP
jgi:hypothetical protein